jgi:Ca2+-binding RTX toxin-like protein
LQGTDSITGFEGLIGGSGNDSILGTSGDDVIGGGNGNDTLIGGDGFDTVIIVGRSSQFKLVFDGGVTYIDALSGASAMTERAQLTNVEQVQFLDKTVSLVVNDTIKGGPGIDFFDGGLGLDTVVYSGPQERYTINKTGNRYVVSESTGSDDTDYLSNIERLQFSNGKVALDVETGNAGEAAKLIGALLGPTYVKDKALAGIVINLLDQKYSSDTIANLGLATPMFLSMAGSSSNTDFVKQVFTNVVGRAPTPSESSTYVNMLDAGTSQSALALMAAQTDLNAARINLVGLIQHGLEFA